MTGQRKALIIANDEYEQESLRNLLAPGADAAALARVLGDAQIGGFAVQVVRNEPAHVIVAQIEDLFSESRPDDVLLLHFSCHGLKSDAGELFFAAFNTRPNRLRATAVSADFVQRCMQDARSRSIVLLLDCCYGGAFSQGAKIRAAGDANVLDSFPQGRSGGGHGRAVITASSAMEYAFEGDRLADDQHQRPSVFTSALVEGLATGDADRDEDGLVSLNELYDYVFDKVREQNPHQTPSRRFELEGELYLARSRRQRIGRAAIPPDLRAAIADSNLYARSGAVHELESRLFSDDLPVAAGAYDALAELARTDVRYVADLAADALGRAAVQPEETEVHFGEQRQESDPPHRTVRLLGPPLARACVPRASHGWIRVAQTASGLDISIDTTGTGPLRGSVELTGPTGTAVIAVDAELLPRASQASRARRPVPPLGQEGPVRAVPAAKPGRRSAAGEHKAAQQAATGVSKAQAHPNKSPAILSLRLALPGALAVAGAILSLAGLFPNYMFVVEDHYSGYAAWFPLPEMTSWWSWFIVATAVLSVAAGVCSLTRRWEPFPTGLLVAAAAAAAVALSYNLYRLVPSVSDDPGYYPFSQVSAGGPGYWLQLASNLSVILAAFLGVSALARTREVSFIRPPRRGKFAIVICLLGAAGALSLAFQDYRLMIRQPVEAPSIAMTVLALVIPILAVAVPRRFGIAILGGWIWTGAAFSFFSCMFFYAQFYHYYPVSRAFLSVPAFTFGLTLLALAVTAILFARAESRAARP